MVALPRTCPHCQQRILHYGLCTCPEVRRKVEAETARESQEMNYRRGFKDGVDILIIALQQMPAETKLREPALETLERWFEQLEEWCWKKNHQEAEWPPSLTLDEVT